MHYGKIAFPIVRSDKRKACQRNSRLIREKFEATLSETRISVGRDGRYTLRNLERAQRATSIFLCQAQAFGNSYRNPIEGLLSGLDFDPLLTFFNRPTNRKRWSSVTFTEFVLIESLSLSAAGRLGERGPKSANIARALACSLDQKGNSKGLRGPLQPSCNAHPLGIGPTPRPSRSLGLYLNSMRHFYFCQQLYQARSRIHRKGNARRVADGGEPYSAPALSKDRLNGPVRGIAIRR